MTHEKKPRISIFFYYISNINCEQVEVRSLKYNRTRFLRLLQLHLSHTNYFFTTKKKSIINSTVCCALIRDVFLSSRNLENIFYSTFNRKYIYFFRYLDYGVNYDNMFDGRNFRDKIQSLAHKNKSNCNLYSNKYRYRKTIIIFYCI